MSDSDADDDVDQYAQLQPGDTLEYGGVTDVLDEGYSPPERPWNCRDHESLADRLADELPESWGDDDPDGDGDDGLGDTRGTDGELRDDEVGDTRAGRLTVDGGAAALAAGDAGVDGAGASAEEAAVHVIPARAVEP
ncbi:DUF5709 domain-containing protein [Pseudonocardia nantongensis]|uniref:DUF5709 domain-containing protein n=1 Tax=Pseudonocardia nantongensis TaxID=1181885 RepID=UPI00397E6D85